MLWVSLVSISSCNSMNSKSSNNDSIVGTWCEYRDDGDDYLLSTFVFNSDGSGVFKVKAITNTQRRPFTWSQNGQDVYVYHEDGEMITLSYNRGLIIEHSTLFGEIVFKKQ